MRCVCVCVCVCVRVLSVNNVTHTPTLLVVCVCSGAFNKKHAVVKRFWQAVSELSDDDKTMLIKFAWGRSRLPRDKWPTKFKLQSLAKGDDSLPHAHSCFFKVRSARCGG